MKFFIVKNKLKQKLGFALAELLVTIGILSILTGFGFVAVVQYQENLKLTELDGQAKQIFIAAQNHLSQSKASGELRRYLENTSAANLLNTLGYPSGDPLYYIIYNANAPDTAQNGSALRNVLLPFGSIDEQIRTEGSYVIGYNPVTGIVRSVLFTDNGATAGLGFHSFKTTGEGSAFQGEKDTNLGTDFYKNDALRKQYGKAESRTGYGIVGYYDGSDTPDPGHTDPFPTLKLIPHNEEILSLEFVSKSGAGLHDFSKPDCPYQINLVIKGAHQDAAKPGISIPDVFSRTNRILANGKGNQLILDDITDSGRGNLHFAALLTADCGITPGDDLLFTAELVRKNVISEIATASATANSLFGRYSTRSIYETIRSGEGAGTKTRQGETEVAEIANFRHFQNLSQTVSGFEPGILLGDRLNKNGTGSDPYFEADQIQNLTFGAPGSVFQNTTVITESGLSGHNGHTEAGMLFSLNPNYAICYKGIGSANQLNDLSITPANEGGIFGLLHRSIKVENLVLNNLYVGANIAGGLIGEITEVDQPTNITINDVVLKSEEDNRKISSIEGQIVGGLIGHVNTEHGIMTIMNSASTAYVHGHNAGAVPSYAGGLVGYIENAHTGSDNSGIALCYVGGHTKTVSGENVYGTDTNPVSRTSPSTAADHVNVCSTTGYAGGFIGYCDKLINLTACYSTASVYGKTEASAFMPHHNAALDPYLNNVYGIGYVGTESTALQYDPFNGALANQPEGTAATAVAKPYNADLRTVPSTIYPYQSVNQLFKNYIAAPGSTKFLRPAFRNLKESDRDLHYGDWIVQNLSSIPIVRFTNAERLYATIAFDAEYKGKIAFALEQRAANGEDFDPTIDLYSIEIDYSKENAAGYIGNADIKIKGPKSDALPVIRYAELSSNKKVRKVTFALDDITMPQGHFRDLSNIAPGSSINGYASIDPAVVNSNGTGWIRNAAYHEALTDADFEAADIAQPQPTEGEVYATRNIWPYDWTNSVFATLSNEEAKLKVTGDTDGGVAVTQPQPTTKTVDAKHTALIRNIRHLQNLDPEISGITDNRDDPYVITKAKQLVDLDWDDFTGKIAGDAKDQVLLYNVDGTAATLRGNFYGVANANLLSYEGIQDVFDMTPKLRMIQNLKMNNLLHSDEDRDEDRNAGLFRYIKGNAGEGFTIQYLGLKNSTIYGYNAGGLVGCNDNGCNLSFQHILIEDTAVLAHRDAGGVIGRAYQENGNNHSTLSFTDVVVRDRHQDNRNLNLNDSGILIYSDGGDQNGEITEIAGSVGGILGRSIYTETNFTNCLVYGRNFRVINNCSFGQNNKNVDSSAGGLAGTLKYAKYTLENSAASVYVYAPKGDSAGGLVGDMSSADEKTKVEKCYAGGITSVGKPSDLPDAPDARDVFLNAKAFREDDDHLMLDLSNAVQELNKNSFRIVHEGGYNIYGNLTSGGLFGYVNDNCTIEDCFSTNSTANSMYALSMHNKGTAYTGGFIGRLWSSKSGNEFDIKLTNNYAAGKVYEYGEYSDDRNAQCGSFLGGVNKQFIKNPSDANRSSKNYSLLGINFNLDGKLVGETNGGDSDDLLIDNDIISTKSLTDPALRPGNATKTHKTTCINHTKDDYPLKNKVTVGIHNQTIHTDTIEFYGDWEDPSLSAENGNRLEMHYDAPFIPRHIYNWTIKVTGTLSGEVKYFGLHFVTGNTANTPLAEHSYQNPESMDAGYRLYESETTYQLGDAFSNGEDGRVAYNKQDLIDFTITEQGIHLNFMFDDLTRKRGHFATNFPKFYPGEDLEIKMINAWKNPDDATEQEKNGIGYNEFIVNSLFDSVSKIGSTKIGNETINNYVAKIGNSRHLLNLDRTLSEAGTKVAGSGDYQRYYNSFNSKTHTGWPRIYGAEQIDNIIFKHQNNVQDVSTYTDPFIDEIKQKTGESGSLIIYSTWETVDVAGDHLKPLHPRYLRYYDGKGYTIENADILASISETNTALFTRVEPGFIFQNNSAELENGNAYHLTVQNVNLMNLTVTINPQNKTAAAGIVATVDNGAKLRLQNIGVSGTIKIEGSNSAGGLVGNTDGETFMQACSFRPDNGYILATNSDGFAGGILGVSTSNSKTTLEDIRLQALSFFTIQGNQYAGGMVGLVQGQRLEANRNQCFGSLLLVKSMGDNHMTVDDKQWNYASGGLIGKLSGVNAVSIQNSMASAFVTTRGQSSGGFIGEIENCDAFGPGQAMIRGCYSSGHTKNGQYGTSENQEEERIQADSSYFNTYARACSGGFIGLYHPNHPTIIKDCYSTASALGGTSETVQVGVAGFIGTLMDSLTLANCYSTGLVKTYHPTISNAAHVGSFIGYVADGKDITVQFGSQFMGSFTGIPGNENLNPVGNRSEPDFHITPQAAASPVNQSESYDPALSSLWYPYRSQCVDPKGNPTDPDVRSFYGDWPNQNVTVSTQTLQPSQALQQMAPASSLSTSLFAATRTTEEPQSSVISETDSHIPDQILDAETRPEIAPARRIQTTSSPGA